jgi:hypothetical protein
MGEVVEVDHCPRPAKPSRMLKIGPSEVMLRTICHNELCIIRYLQMSSRL